MSEPSPFSQLVEWYDAQPPELRQDIAFQLVALARESKASREPEETLRLLWRAVDPRSSLANAGAAVSYAALIDFVLHERRSKDDWNRAARMSSEVVERARADGEHGLAAAVESNREQLALRSRMWIRAAEAWAELRRTTLSIEGIHLWLQGALAAEIRDR